MCFCHHVLFVVCVCVCAPMCVITLELYITQITSLKFVNRNELFITGSADKVSTVIFGLSFYIQVNNNNQGY